MSCLCNSGIYMEDKNQQSTASRILASEIFATPPVIEADRAELITESYRETANLPPILRRARAFEKILGNIPIILRSGELLMGNLCVAPRGVQVFPEYSCNWIEEEFDNFDKRSGDPYLISKETKERLARVFDYWRGNTHSDTCARYLSPQKSLFPAMNANVFTVANYRFAGQGHVSVDYDLVLRKGFKGIINMAMREILSLDSSSKDFQNRKNFLEATIITSKSMINYANRCSRVASEAAIAETDPNRRRELLKLSAICARVPENGASTWHEAIQAFWFVHMGLYLETNGHSMSPGRFDQYMYPYYKSSVLDGDMAEEEANELLDSLWVKFNSVCKLRDAGFAKGFGGYPMFQNLNVGGQKPEGGDATNELSYACLEATIRSRLPQPSLSIRVWRGTPKKLMRKGADLAATGIGMPAWFNDDSVIKCLRRRGVEEKDSLNYCILGCVEPNIGGKTLGMHGAAFFNLVKVLEITLRNGLDNGIQAGLQTGRAEDFSCMDDLLGAYKAQLSYFVDLMANADNSIDIAHGELNPLPYQSSMINGCLQNGKSAQEGGAIYNMTAVQGVGIANVADALMAIQALVFDQKILSMNKMIALLDSNFGSGFKEDTFGSFTAGSCAAPGLISEDAKAITPAEGDYFRQLILNKAPKYGNDMEEVDKYATLVGKWYCEEVEKHTNPRGGRFMAGLYPVSANVPMGKVCGATPDGRMAGEPLAEGVSPAAGRDRLGPTAALNSVARLDHSLVGNGALLNQKFHPSAIAGDSGKDNLTSLIRAYFNKNGSHAQFNVIDRQTLVEAKKHPNRYRNLVVRVAGYSAHFTSLNPAIQDDIISRTEQFF